MPPRRPAGRRRRAAGAAALLAAVGAACTPGAADPTTADAAAFVREAEARLLSVRAHAERAAWVRHTYLSPQTTAVAANARAAQMAETTRLAAAAARFADAALPAPIRRRLDRLRTAAAAAVPGGPGPRQELAAILASLAEAAAAPICPAGPADACLDRPTAARRLAVERDTDRLISLWEGWRAAAPPVRPHYARLAALATRGARALGFADADVRWRSAYDLPPEALRVEVDRLWREVRPLYESLHCLVRAGLGGEYGTAIVPPDGPIPAHLLGSPWGDRWDGIVGRVARRDLPPDDDLTRALARRRTDPAEMVREGERFFRSIGFDPLPAAFRRRSILVPPADRAVDCRPRVWSLDAADDLRITLCLEEPTREAFMTVHRLIARAHVRRAVRGLSPLVRGGAHAVLPEAAARAVTLSITPAALARTGVRQTAPSPSGDLPFLLRQALERVAPLPFHLLVDRWRGAVFAGRIAPDRYNAAWWALRTAYQGVGPPAPRADEAFDPGGLDRVAAHEPALPSFLAGILQFQIHRALCAAAGIDGPPHRCSIVGRPAAGARLASLLEAGASRPWPEILAAFAGAYRMDAGALLDYFAPLAAWLDDQNAGRACGWRGAAA